MTELQIANLNELQSFANRLVAVLPRNVAIGLVGTLGAGKTSLSQAIARAIGIDSREVTSPTFTLLQSHQGDRKGQPVTLNHLDAYRIADEDEFTELGVDELFDDESAWTIVEWADRVKSCLPAQTLWLTLSLVADSNARLIEMSTTDATLAAEIQAIAGTG